MVTLVFMLLIALSSLLRIAHSDWRTQSWHFSRQPTNMFVATSGRQAALLCVAWRAQIVFCAIAALAREAMQMSAGLPLGARAPSHLQAPIASRLLPLIGRDDQLTPSGVRPMVYGARDEARATPAARLLVTLIARDDDHGNLRVL